MNKQKQTIKEKKADKKVCFRCNNIIVPEARHISLLTYDKKEIVEAVHFHIVCWGEYNQERVNDRIKQMASVGARLIKPMLESSARYNY